MAVAIVFIGASVVPACAQKKSIVKGAKAALGKKPPMTGTAPIVVKPVTPRVPPTLQGATVPTRTAIAENVLNVAVERQLDKTIIPAKFRDRFVVVLGGQMSTEQFLDHFLPNDTDKPGTTTEKIMQQLREIDISRVLENTEGKDWSLWSVNNRKSFPRTDFTNLITPNTPKLIPISANTEINTVRDVLKETLQEEKAYGQGLFHERPNRGTGPLNTIVLIAAVEKIDNFFFVKKNGQVFVNVASLSKVHSYEEALAKLGDEINSKFFQTALKPTSYLIELRNKQIADALKAANNTAAPQFKGIPQTDPTTQRTAEEIKSLVENLDPENPLRKAMEKILQEEGYTVP